MVTSGGIHGVFAVCQALLEPGDEVLVPDPEWPPAQGNVACAHGGAGAAIRSTRRTAGGPTSRKCAGS